MWNVTPRLLCRRHLLGEHVEMHMFVGAILIGTSLKGYLEKGLVEIHNIKARHSLLAEEITRRGMHHRSPLDNFEAWIDGKVDVAKNIVDLCSRCIECKKLIKGD